MTKNNAYFSYTLQQAEFSTDNKYHTLLKNCPQSGAIITFTGLVRDISKQSDTIEYLELQVYEKMALQQMQHIGEEVLRRFDIEGLDILHRYGKLKPSDLIVYVGVASKHRSEAYLASQMTMDFLKSKVAFWKKEHYKDQSESQWIEPTTLDSESLKQWLID